MQLERGLRLTHRSPSLTVLIATRSEYSHERSGREERKYLIKNVKIKCKKSGVGSHSPALLHCKYTTRGAKYIGLKVGVKSRDRVREKVEEQNNEHISKTSTVNGNK